MPDELRKLMQRYCQLGRLLPPREDWDAKTRVREQVSKWFSERWRASRRRLTISWPQRERPVGADRASVCGRPCAFGFNTPCSPCGPPRAARAAAKKSSISALTLAISSENHFDTCSRTRVFRVPVLPRREQAAQLAVTLHQLA